MITISGVLGVGLYIRGGVILRLGGPLAVLLSFAILGFLAWGVMQCISEMLCIWPISGALTVYVTEFVDVELGIAVGVAYWFTYAISFAALTTATAGIAEYWDTAKGIQGAVLFFLIPSLLVVINAFGIEIYGFVEVIGGTLKLVFLVVIVVVMIAINQGAGATPRYGTTLFPDRVIVHDEEVTNDWAQAFLMSLSIAAFAYVGVEITAASALEARVPKEENPTKTRAIGKTIKFSAVYIPFFAGTLYVLAGVLVTLNIEWDNGDLPRMSWVGSHTEYNHGSTHSAFVLVAKRSEIPGLAGTLNVFLMFTALTCANTNLYVASRALFSLTRSLDGGSGQPWYTRFLATLGKTNNRKVPLRALLASCIFAWIPFLYLANSSGPETSIGTLLDVLSEMGSVGVIIVWACECWAYIRFHQCIKHDKEALREVPLVRRWNRGTNELDDDFPYRSHGQPITAYLSLAACLFILIVANGASLWKSFHVQPFLAAYLAPICFLALWVLLKVLRKGQWRLIDLSNDSEVANKMLILHEIRFRQAETTGTGPRGIKNLWGLL
ncbi:amino acid permease/ SLC12A domain-containing protein [Pyrenochaeta sp. MPI-SDFR-AT-0127]|nr:amino acid permease/ SLC12A domain-containing protein [Pyrenochaeta sp. MPI-SDFR-AT-0127]